MVPEARETARPKAWFIIWPSNPSRRPAAAVEPNTPDIEVGWNPASMWASGPTAMPARPMAS